MAVRAALSPAAPVWWLAVALFATHVAINQWSVFEFQRDEFLYLAMGDHLQWWRMDFPPLIALLANVTRAVAGDSLVAIRLGPAVAGSLLVLATGNAVRLMDGSVRAQWVAALAVVAAPVILRPGLLFQPVIFDQFWWTCALLALMQRQRTDNPRWWIAIGVALGLGLLTKFSIAFIGVGIVGGMLATPMRRDLLTRWPWLALIIGSASLVGQLQLDFPISWQMKDLQSSQLERRAIWAFVAEQPLLVGPIAFCIAIVGLLWMFIGIRAAWTRAAAIAMLIAWCLLSVSRGKAYYGAPIYPLCLAAGAVAIDQLVRERWRRVVMLSVAALLVLVGGVALPIALPILSPDATARYAARLGIEGATRTNSGTTLPLPQDFADMLGWEAMVQAAAEEWRALPAGDRERAVLGASNYGQAGALDHYGRRLGLPPVVSGAGSYWFFGPGEKPGEVLLVVGEELAELEQLYTSCAVRRIVGSPWLVEEEQRVPITVCRGPRQTLQAAWPQFHPAL